MSVTRKLEAWLNAESDRMDECEEAAMAHRDYDAETECRVRGQAFREALQVLHRIEVDEWAAGTDDDAPTT